MAAQVWEIPLRRENNTKPWGFRLKGGSDQGIPLHVEHVNPKSRAAGAGMQVGDYVLAISGVNVQNATHPEVKSEMLRAGNELDVIVQRGEGSGSFTPAQAPPAPQAAQQAAQQAQAAEPRSGVCEEHIMKMGGPTYKPVSQATFKVLQDELPASEAGMGDKPSSIFNRKKQERSGYLHAQGPSIQKAYGES